MTITDTLIKALTLVISLRLKASTKFSSHLMDLRILSLLVLLNLVLATLRPGLAGVIKTVGSFAAGTVPGLVQLRADNMNPSIG
jgi:hypothetical protein